MSKWPVVPLGEVLRHRKEFIQISDSTNYKRCRVQLHAQGIVLRDQIAGIDIKTKKQQVCQAGEFLVAEIDAKVGGYGIVPQDLNGAIVSSHYFLFGIDETKLDRTFLAYFIRTPAFAEQVTAQGSTNYAAIRPGHVLQYTLPLPGLAEQRRVVEYIDGIAAKLAEVRRLGDESSAKCAEICRSILRDGSNGPPTPTMMSELVTLREPDVRVRPDEVYHFAGVYCFGRGVFVGQQKPGMEFMYPKLTRLRAGNFVYPKLMAWEGALAVVPPECDGLVVSTEYPVFEIDQAKVLPEVIDVYFRTPSIWPALAGASTGTNVRRRRLNPTDFLRHRMPLPTRASQFKLKEVQQRVTKAIRERQKVTKELEAMLPAILDQVFSGAI